MKKTLLLAGLAIILAVMVVLQPDTSFQASLQGLQIWWNIVFPSLLPFLILFEIMLAFGLIRGLSVLLEPFSKYVLKLPGASAVTLGTGWLGGSPTGAEATAQLLQRGLLSKEQAARTLAYSFMPNPLFVIIIAGTLFLNQPLAGTVILFIIGLANFCAMLLHSKWRSKKDTMDTVSGTKIRSQSPIFKRAADAMQLGRLEDGRSFGKVLGDAVAVSVQKLFIVGGFIIFSSMAAAIISPLIDIIQLPFLGKALLESHLGAHAIGEWGQRVDNWLLILPIMAAALSLGGLSNLMQVSYTVYEAGISMKSFLRYRLMHALIAFILGVLLTKPAMALANWQQSVFWPGAEPEGLDGLLAAQPVIAAFWSSIIFVFLVCTLFILLLASYLLFVSNKYFRKAD